MKNSIPLLMLFMLLFLSTGKSRCQKREDVVYLSGGTTLRGIAKTDSIDGIIRILNHAGDIWVFPLSEVDSMIRERPVEYKASLFNQKGFELGIRAGFLIRSRSNAIGNAVIPGMTMVFGYRMSPYFSAGAGMGMQFYDTMEIPFFLSLKARSSVRALSPFILAETGYTLPAEKKPDDWDYSYTSYGGFNGTIGLGIERILSENSSFVVSFAYHYQALNYRLTPLGSWVLERDRKEIYSRFLFSLGYIFK